MLTKILSIRHFCQVVNKNLRLISKNLSSRSTVTQIETPTNSCPGQKVEVDGIKIHYEQIGKGDLKVLLLPGAIGSGRTDFSPQLAGFDEDKFTLIAWDPPGYGYSRPPERNFSGNFYFTDANFAAQTMKKLGHFNYSVVGWSDGGNTGMILAALAKQAVTKLVIWGSNAYITSVETHILKSIRDVSKWNEKMRAPLEALYGKQGLSELWEAYVDAIENNFKVDDGNICMEVLPNISCPTLILHGDRDPMINPEHPPYLMKHIANAQLHRFPEGKHNIHLRYAKEFNQIVQDFILK